ncbi:hypothetical protein VTK73DRAFT_1395 [Phialemonium thermophilum]|uniref:FAD-binding domain-containing protein n=1 Tax=Phialemonium thermophilum TaxID=223376 RepID=A0ABR3VTH7_9PEZI
MPSPSSFSVAIVGGGIGGLTMALSIAHHVPGLRDITVYEQAPAYKEIGAGIGIGVNAGRILKRLGVYDAAEAISGWRNGIHRSLRRWDDGREIVTVRAMDEEGDSDSDSNSHSDDGHNHAGSRSHGARPAAKTTKEEGSSLRPYVKIQVHTSDDASTADPDDRPPSQDRKARTRTGKGRDVDFSSLGGRTTLPSSSSSAVTFRGIAAATTTTEHDDELELAFVRFVVRDDRLGRDALLAWACVRLDRLRTGYRFVHLLDARGVETDAVLLVRVAKRWL